MVTYKIKCPICGHEVRCHDSMSDARQGVVRRVRRVGEDAAELRARAEAERVTPSELLRLSWLAVQSMERTHA